MKMLQLSVAALLSAALLTTACDDDDDDPTGPEPTDFTVALTRAQETAACTGTPGATASGTATATINAANTSITVDNLTFTGLSAAPTAAHIHSGATGVAGGIVLNFGTPVTSGMDKTFTAADYVGVAPSPTTFAAFVTAMKAGNAYINIHTAACPDGEIRGQLVVVP